MRHRAERLAVSVVIAGLLAAPQRGHALAHPGAAAKSLADQVERLVADVGERVRHYHDRIASVACTETVSQQELRGDLTPRGKPREFVYDLIIVREPARADGANAEVRVERQLKLIDGRSVRLQERSRCTDPQAVYRDPLTFLLPENRSGYRFSPAVGSGPAPIVVDFVQIEPEPTSVTWEEQCFTASGGRSAGRVWIDSTTRDVLQLETKLAEPFRITRPPSPTQSGIRSHKIERFDVVARFRTIVFQDPEETLLLPESIVTLAVVTPAQTRRMQTTQTFTNYKRFITEVKIKDVR